MTQVAAAFSSPMHVSISAITFSDETTITVSPGDLIVIVGSNNSGKSAALRGINEKAQYSPHTSPVVKHVTLAKGGNEDELLVLLGKHCSKRNTPPENPHYEGAGINIHLNTAKHHWSRSEGLGDLLPLFVRYLTAEARISAANPTGRINIAEQAPQHPLHLRGADYRPPDVMYTHCGGKARLPMVVRSLRKLSVPVAVVTDFDVLSEERPLKDIVEAAGGNWDEFAEDHLRVKKAIDDRRPELPLIDARREIEAGLSASVGNVLSTESRKKIEKTLRRSSPWAIAKDVGKTYVPSGDASVALERLLAALNNFGIFVVEVGELESFAKTVAGHGPNWVNEALKRNFRSDAEFQHARDFVSKFAL